MSETVFVVVRYDGDADSASAELANLIIRVKAVYRLQEDAEREVFRLNALGRSHYFYQQTRLHEKAPERPVVWGKPIAKTVFDAGWAVGEIPFDDKRTLNEKIRDTSDRGFLLITWISADPRFTLPSTVWERLAEYDEVAVDVGLGLVTARSKFQHCVPHGVETYVSLVSDDLSFRFSSSSPRLALEELTAHLMHHPVSEGPTMVHLGRHAKHGQITLRFPQKLIQLLGVHCTTIEGYMLG